MRDIIATCAKDLGSWYSNKEESCISIAHELAQVKKLDDIKSIFYRIEYNLTQEGEPHPEGHSSLSYLPTRKPAIFIYRIYEEDELESVVAEAYARVIRCNCENGCYKCIKAKDCGEENEDLDKKAAILILEYLSEGLRKRE